ncbi:hypothetical protein A4R35_10270 [Thermogemmatispora tikiterensis]|uniref:Uncharacterized protein n=1 Tax=Thermogemmatispora tikiterensis TaxID=1825093 RepID=A0A328VJH1_9CHLR|nr:hypothetical protein A4R35_10270 [Thermogemmatispora tikiterensis]
MVAPVRHLLLLLWQGEDPARWGEVQRWLAAFWLQQAREGREAERVGAVQDWCLHRLLLGDPPSQLLSELAAWPWPSPEERRRALQAVQQDQDLLQLLQRISGPGTEAAAAWQAGLQRLTADHPGAAGGPSPET